jgi:exoribonuclease R
VGLLRTLPPPPDEVVQRLRRSAEGLGLEWEDQITYQDFIRRLDPAKPRAAAFLSAARTIFRGSSYTFFDATLPEHPAHHAIAAPYAHVTAPLRRMADRLTNELVLRLSKRPNLPEWLLDRLEEVPEAMKHADSRDRELESRIVDYVEAMMLQARVGQTFEGLIVESGAHGGLVQLKDPAVLGACKGVSLPLGHHMEVRLAKADPESSRIEFIPA